MRLGRPGPRTTAPDGVLPLLQPTEKIGEDNFLYSRDGGFAYKKTNGTADYYPVVHVQKQLQIAEYLRQRHERGKKFAGYLEHIQKKQLTSTKAALIEIDKLQEKLPKALRDKYVAEKWTERMNDAEKPIWTIFKIYRINDERDGVRSDFKEVYRLKVGYSCPQLFVSTCSLRCLDWNDPS